MVESYGADVVVERGADFAGAIQIKPVFVRSVIERTEWLEQLRDLVSAGNIELLVAGAAGAGKRPASVDGYSQRRLP